MAKGMYVGVKSTLDPAQDSFKIVSSSKQDFVDRKIIVPGGVGGSKYWDTTNMTSSTFYPNEAVDFASSTIWPSSFSFSNKFFLFSNDLTHLYVITSVSNKTEIKTEISTYALDPGSSVEITASGSVYDIAESPSVARKVNKIYVGIDNIAYKVKKGYVGIGGVARPFFGAGVPMYYGRATDITVDRTCMSGVTMGSYALFVGGLKSVNYSGDTPSNSIDIYDNKLVHTTNTLSGSRYRMAGVGMTDWSLFAGGKTGADENTNCSATVYKIDNNFVKTVASTGLTTAVWAVAGSSVGDYALVAGGRTNTRSGVVSNVAAYNKSLTKTVVSSLTTANAFMAGCRLNDNLVIFGGGNKESKINSYNSSLTQGASSQTFYDNKNMGTAVLDGKAVYAGGYDNNGTGKPQVYLFDSSLTRSEVSVGLIKGRPAAGVTMDDYILFGGGYYGTTAGAWQCDIYDESLTRTNPTEDLGRLGISSISYTPSGVKVGNYALFAGDYYTWARAFVQA